jgi:hypothetical protein
LEDEGVGFPESERRAFATIRAEMQAAIARGERIEYREPSAWIDRQDRRRLDDIN